MRRLGKRERESSSLPLIFGALTRVESSARAARGVGFRFVLMLARVLVVTVLVRLLVPVPVTVLFDLVGSSSGEVQLRGLNRARSLCLELKWRDFSALMLTDIVENQFLVVIVTFTDSLPHVMHLLLLHTVPWYSSSVFDLLPSQDTSLSNGLLD